MLKKISLNWNQCRLAIKAITELAVLGRDKKNMNFFSVTVEEQYASLLEIDLMINRVGKELS